MIVLKLFAVLAMYLFAYEHIILLHDFDIAVSLSDYILFLMYSIILVGE